MVRRALAVTLRNSPHLPHEIAQRLIADIDDIAVPVLEASPVLTDEDLVRVLRAGEESKQIAVATRDTVSGPVCEAVVSLCGVTPNSALAGNDGAENEFRGLIALVEGKPVGLVHFLFHRHGWKIENVCYLQDLYADHA